MPEPPEPEDPLDDEPEPEEPEPDFDADELDESDVEELFRRAAAAEAAGQAYRLTVDLQTCLVHDDGGFSRSFTVDPFRRHCLLEGLDNIGLSLKHVDQITAWENAHDLAPLQGGAT